ncbi:MAG TPA: mandelate racemase/muconate lactonizing enzyme family protein [Trebonia sp.]|jgi:L-alanine-DL-glutamate epimerase-like enolase superfamily enzyme|nr:mandelate racemase/muconate lactonizing enzyme family protein [Trebonia sp.]
MTAIERVTVRHVRYPLPRPLVSGFGVMKEMHSVLAEVTAGGQSGLGYTWGFDEAEATRVRELAGTLARSLPGTDATDLRARTSELRAAAAGLSRAGDSTDGDSIDGDSTDGDSTGAASALDMALWDLAARLRGEPVSVLLGSPPRTHAMYGSGGWLSLSLDELVADAVSFQDRGYAGFKMRVGGPDLETDIERIRAVAERLRPGFFLAVDANQGWTRDQAARACDRLSDAGLAWIEEPLSAADIEGLAALRRRTDVPLSAGETLPGTEPVADLVRGQAVDVFQPDLMHCGGVTPFLELAGLAARHDVRVAPHLYAEMSAHLMAAVPTGTLIEHVEGWFEHLFSRGPRQQSGTVTPTGEPGFGLAFNAETIRRYGRAELVL